MDKKYRVSKKLNKLKAVTRSMIESGNISQRLKYRMEFLRRNDDFKKLNDTFRKMMERIPRNALGFYSKEERSKKELGKLLELSRSLPIDDSIVDSDLKLEETVASSEMSSIEVAFCNRRYEEPKMAGTKYLQYQEPALFLEFAKRNRQSREDLKEERKCKATKALIEFGRPDPPIASLDAVNLEDRTITIKIHLDRKKDDILKDFKLLLHFLHWEAEYLEMDLGSPKKPQWDVYDKYLQAWDLKKANPKMEWSEIAERVIPEEAYPNPNKRGKKKILVQQSSIDKVRYYWREANRMINKEGWKQI